MTSYWIIAAMLTVGVLAVLVVADDASDSPTSPRSPADSPGTRLKREASANAARLNHEAPPRPRPDPSRISPLVAPETAVGGRGESANDNVEADSETNDMRHRDAPTHPLTQEEARHGTGSTGISSPTS